MGYKALYRVYRPRTFEEVVGQEHICDVLKKQVETGQISHAYIFSGPRGTGKTSCARILANAVNCLHPENGNPCLKCAVCESAASDTMIDIVELDAASNNGVDNIRDIREKVSLLPAAGRYKVYILDEVHMLSAGAVNALLKTLEEPPPHAIFILATTEIRKIPKTILSRCQQFDFKRISVQEAVRRLRLVAGDAGIPYEQEALELLARAGEGAMRDSLSLMDMCAAGGKSLTLENVSRVVGSADAGQMDRLAGAVLESDAAGVLLCLHEMLNAGAEPLNILRDTISNLSIKLSGNVADESKSRYILRALEILIGAQGVFRFATTPEVLLETSFLRAALPETDTGAKDLAVRIERLEKRLDGLEKAPRPPIAEEKRPEPPQKTENVQMKQASVLEAAVHGPEKEQPDNDDIEARLINMLGRDKVEIKE